MKKLSIFSLILLLATLTCSEKKDVFSLEEGSQSYDLAQVIATQFPSLHLDADVVLVESRKFSVTAAEAIHELRLNMGLNAQNIKKLSPENVKGLIENSAQKTAEKKLLLYKAKKSGIKVSDAEIADALERQYSQTGSKEKFLELIKKNGLDIEYVKKDIAKDLIMQRYIEEKIYGKIQISEEEIRYSYLQDKTVTIRQILLRTEGKEIAEKEEIRKQMEEIWKRVKEGESFAELAKKYSQDQSSKDKGGLIEDLGRGYLEKPLDEAAFTIPPGEFSDIIETPIGYYIIKVIERKKESRPFEEVREKLAAKIRNKKQWEEYHSHIAILKQELGFRIKGL